MLRILILTFFMYAFYRGCTTSFFGYISSSHEPSFLVRFLGMLTVYIISIEIDSSSLRIPRYFQDMAVILEILILLGGFCFFIAGVLWGMYKYRKCRLCQKISLKWLLFTDIFIYIYILGTLLISVYSHFSA